MDPFMILLQLGAVGSQAPFKQKAIDSAKKIVTLHYGANSEAMY